MGAIAMASNIQTGHSVGAALGSTAPNLSLCEHAVLRKEGEYWTVGYAGTEIRLKDMKGLAYIARLLRCPGIEVHALDLARGEATPDASDRYQLATFSLKRQELDNAGLHVGGLGDAGDMLDDQAKATYRRRLAELRDELEEAKELGRIDRAESAEREIEALTTELSRATGLGGRNRRASSAAERARQSVTRGIKSALSKITNENVVLGQLLSRCVKTGIYFCYKPDANHTICWDSAAPNLEESSSAWQADFSGTESQAVASPIPRACLNQIEFVDRHAQTELVRGLLKRALSGQGSVVMLGGAPGVGKTRLAMEIAEYASCRGFRYLIGRCYEREEPCPYLPFAEIIEAALVQAPSPEVFRQWIGGNAGEYAQIAPSLRRVFPDIPESLQLPPQQARRFLSQSVAETLKRMADAMPLVLILDDLQWADESSLTLLNYLASRVAHIPAVIIATYRDLDLETNPALARTLEELLRIGIRPTKLHGLSEDSVAQMIRNLSSREPPSHVVKVIFEETQGNPFLVEEVYRHLVEERKVFDSSGEFRTDFSIEDIRLPESVRLVLDRRLERLGYKAKAVLTTAAAIGRTFSFGVLQSLQGQTDPDELMATIEQAQRMGLVVSSSDARESSLSFAHDLLRQTLLADISVGR
jgi:predicted ATPase